MMKYIHYIVFLAILSFYGLGGGCMDAQAATDKKGKAPNHSLEKGLRLYERRNFAQAFQILLPLAQKNELRAIVPTVFLNQNYMGTASHENDLANKLTEDQAFSLVKSNLARITDLPESEKIAWAYNDLGDIYYWGLGVDKNIDQAIEYWQKGVAGGNPSAMVNLGYVTAFHLGDKEDLAKAYELMLRAAELNYPRAMATLGNFLSYYSYTINWRYYGDRALLSSVPVAKMTPFTRQLESIYWFMRATQLDYYDDGGYNGYYSLFELVNKLNNMGDLFAVGQAAFIDANNGVSFKNQLDYALGVKWYREAFLVAKKFNKCDLGANILGKLMNLAADGNGFETKFTEVDKWRISVVDKNDGNCAAFSENANIIIKKLFPGLKEPLKNSPPSLLRTNFNAN